MRPANELIDAFCDQVWLQDGLAATSLASYRRDLTAWADWLAGHAGKALLAAERTDVEAFLAAQFRARAKATSIGRRLSSLRRFYRLHIQQGTVKADPTLRVQAPKLPRRLPKNLSETQVEALLDAPDTKTTLGLRDRAMLETLYACGLRVSELVSLRLAQVSLDMGVVRALGKGSKERMVPLGEEAIGWLARYLATARVELAAQTPSRRRFPHRPARPDDAAGILAAGQTLRDDRRHFPRVALAARAAARVRDPSAEPRRRSARRAIAARPFQHHDDDDLHARCPRTPETAARRSIILVVSVASR